LNLIKEVFSKTNDCDYEMQKAIIKDVKRLKQTDGNLKIKAIKECNEGLFSLLINDKKHENFGLLLLKVQAYKEAPFQIKDCKYFFKMDKSMIPRTSSLLEIIKFWWKFEFSQ